MSDLEPIRRNLQKLATAILDGAAEEDKPMLFWPLACGSAVAHKTEAVAFRDGILTVEVPDAAWRTQLSDMAGQYLTALRKLLGDRVQRIEFVVAKPAALGASTKDKP